MIFLVTFTCSKEPINDGHNRSVNDKNYFKGMFWNLKVKSFRFRFIRGFCRIFENFLEILVISEIPSHGDFEILEF